jgi:hypothetical protein
MRQPLGQDAAGAMGGAYSVGLGQPSASDKRLLQDGWLNPLVAGLQQRKKEFRGHDELRKSSD